jgi:hypothetical protein
MATTVEQRSICERVGSAIVSVDPTMKVGVALATINKLPLNALRHAPAGETAGWYIWGGEALADDEDFFNRCMPRIWRSSTSAFAIPCTGAGWRVLLAPASKTSGMTMRYSETKRIDRYMRSNRSLERSAPAPRAVPAVPLLGCTAGTSINGFRAAAQ